MYNNYITVSCCLAKTKIEFRGKGNRVYKYVFKVGEILNYSIENANEYSEDAIVVFLSKNEIVVHIQEPLAKILFFSAMKC